MSICFVRSTRSALKRWHKVAIFNPLFPWRESAEFAGVEWQLRSGVTKWGMKSGSWNSNQVPADADVLWAASCYSRPFIVGHHVLSADADVLGATSPFIIGHHHVLSTDAAVSWATSCYSKPFIIIQHVLATTRHLGHSLAGRAPGDPSLNCSMHVFSWEVFRFYPEWGGCFSFEWHDLDTLCSNVLQDLE